MSDLDPSRAVALAQRLMHERGWNVSDLAKAADLDPGTVGDFLAGTRWPRTATRGRIESALGLPGGALLATAHGVDLLPPFNGSRSVRPDSDDAVFVPDAGPTPALSDLDEAALQRRIREGLDAMDELRRRHGA